MGQNWSDCIQFTKYFGTDESMYVVCILFTLKLCQIIKCMQIWLPIAWGCWQWQCWTKSKEKLCSLYCQSVNKDLMFNIYICWELPAHIFTLWLHTLDWAHSIVSTFLSTRVQTCDARLHDSSSPGADLLKNNNNRSIKSLHELCVIVHDYLA